MLVLLIMTMHNIASPLLSRFAVDAELQGSEENNIVKTCFLIHHQDIPARLLHVQKTACACVELIMA